MGDGDVAEGGWSREENGVADLKGRGARWGGGGK